ncbi:NAD-dependent epimerase/dehydratase family protein [Dongia rigui]|uniref:NAD-dependent epimerase/dehydratase family protein n=1 Tax=Dongia rigui TaxID=940149 RepID=A0ABU5E3I8_9PROT|nr:NAD-dependent epimerase/dehydratase family protein [Dongia rigui]MDY0873376.1 NAD-dependent epimerase/dehydratase family protein [Dongia rigui]
MLGTESGEARLSLVTGGCGFMGRHLVSLLSARGERVRVLDLRDWPQPSGLPLPANVELRQGSIRDRAVLSRAMAGVERVYHLAANPNLWAADPATFHEVNYEGTCRVLDAAAEAKIARFVYTSTESILKNINAPRGSQNALIDENVRHSVNDVPGPYCRSKFRAEEAAQAAANAGMPLVIVNPTMPIGPGDFLLTPPTKMILGFLNGTTPAYLDCDFNLVDGRDAALGHLLAAEHGRIGERYILGHENLSLGRLLVELQQLTGLAMPTHKVPYWLAYVSALVSEGVANVTKKPPMAPLTGVRLARSSMAFDCSKAQRELHWQCRPLGQSLRDTVLDLQQRGLLRRQPNLAA